MTKNRYVGKMHKAITDAVANVDNRCLYFDRDGKRCKDRAIQSHSLQKKGPLAGIAENGHVIKVGSSLKARPIEKRQVFERTGVNMASTFAGFCNEHDSEVFQDIETGAVDLNANTALIVSIRALSMEWYRKCVMIALQETAFNELAPNPSSETTDVFTWMTKGALQAQKAGLIEIRRLFSSYHRKPLSNFWHLGIKFSDSLPFACTGAFEPQWSMNEKFLFHNEDPMNVKWNSVSVLAGNIDGTGYAIFSGNQRYRDHRIDHFLKSVNLESSDLASEVFTICLAHSENFFLRPSWLDTLSKTDISGIESLSAYGIMDGIRNPELLTSRIDLPALEALEISKSW